MIMVNRCGVTELFIEQCAHCVAPSKPTPADPFAEAADPSDTFDPKRGPWFTALYHGMCSACGDRFEPGDEIRADGDGGYECCGVIV